MTDPQAETDRPTDVPQILPLGLDAWLVRFSAAFSEAANRAAQAFGAEAVRIDGVEEVLPALASTLVRMTPGALEGGAAARIEGEMRALLRSRDWLALAPAPATRCWTLPVSFEATDAPGLARAAKQVQRSEAQAVEEILQSEVRVLAIGFAPGQPYMGLLPGNWDFPRTTELTKEVPAGALVAAIRQLVLFANPSPTGWTQIGRTGFRPFQPGSDRPMPLRAGDAVRFARVSAEALQRLEREGPMGGARLEVLS